MIYSCNNSSTVLNILTSFSIQYSFFSYIFCKNLKKKLKRKEKANVRYENPEDQCVVLQLCCCACMWGFLAAAVKKKVYVCVCACDSLQHSLWISLLSEGGPNILTVEGSLPGVAQCVYVCVAVMSSQAIGCRYTSWGFQGGKGMRVSVCVCPSRARWPQMRRWMLDNIIVIHWPPHHHQTTEAISHSRWQSPPTMFFHHILAPCRTPC